MLSHGLHGLSCARMVLFRGYLRAPPWLYPFWYLRTADPSYATGGYAGVFLRCYWVCLLAVSLRAGLLGSLFDERWQPLGGHLRELCGNLWRTANLWGNICATGKIWGITQ